MIGRRGFLRAIGAGVLGLSLALRRPEPVLSFEPEPMRGFGMRLIASWEIEEDFLPIRFDTLMDIPLVDSGCEGE